MKIKNIKFKAKQLNSGKWFEGDLVRLGNRVCIGGDHIKDGITDVDPSTVCQFTGLKDCEGNEIWEGDLLKNNDYDGIDSVVFKYGAFCSLANDGKSYCIALTYLSEDNIVYNERVVGNKFDKEM